MSILWRSNKTSISTVRNFMYRKVQEGCECPERKKDHTVVEKQCGCSFTKWKPKPRKVIQCEMDREARPKQPRRCYAGMQPRKPPPDCNLADIDPFKGKPCMDQKIVKQVPPPPKPKKKRLPVADWDMNC